MFAKKSMIVAVGLVAALLVSGAAIIAQSDTSFKDGRINGDINLGGLAIYCVDQFGQPGAPNINDGGMTIWGVGGQKYAELNTTELRGQTALTGAAPAVPTTRLPLLLTHANTVNGTIWLFRTGDDQFVLQGTDNTAKFFTYQWTGCDRGSLSTGGGPLIAVQPTVQATRSLVTPSLSGLTGGGQATVQPTQAATTSPATPTMEPTNAA